MPAGLFHIALQMPNQARALSDSARLKEAMQHIATSANATYRKSLRHGLSEFLDVGDGLQESIMCQTNSVVHNPRFLQFFVNGTALGHLWNCDWG